MIWAFAKKKNLVNYKFYYLKLNFGKNFLEQKVKLNFNFKCWRRYKKISVLRKELKSKWFIPTAHWELASPDTSLRSTWLTTAYDQFKIIPKKKSKNFLKTLFGQLLLESHKKTYNKSNKKILTTQQHRLDYYKLVTAKDSFYDSWQREIFKIFQSSAHSWLYDNLRNQIKDSDQTNKNKINFFKKLYQLYWVRDLREPWLSPLIYKRGFFSSMLEIKRKHNKDVFQDMKVYTRLKNPQQTKKFRLYQHYDKLIYNSWVQGRSKRKKIARTYQIMAKIVSAFYGHLKQKQMKKIWSKTRRKKSCFESHNDSFFAQLERRLDVLVYRLNYAPTILWARRLIWEGAIFVNNLEEIKNWNQMYSSFKIYTFPLKLRDPKRLYDTKYWNPVRWYAKSKFFLEPIFNENYIVQPSEIIQYNPGANNNLFKIHSFLFQKGIQKNILTTTPLSEYWKWKTKSKQTIQLGKYRQEITQTNSAYLTFNPQHTDLDHKNDRIKEYFLNWVVL